MKRQERELTWGELREFWRVIQCIELMLAKMVYGEPPKPKTSKRKPRKRGSRGGK